MSVNCYLIKINGSHLSLSLLPPLSRACYGVLRFIMESGAKGCTVIVSGKLRGQRAKSMKFTDGLMIHAGNPTRQYIDSAVTHVHLRQGREWVWFGAGLKLVGNPLKRMRG